ncbi:flagellar export chaperone FliS [Lederbergia wuyishanensis]|uniref:Flagellar protein FliS n=1 Tax=Lederbergia wuyishanensis TaxID=1347903 RepID=A0ABU0D8T0_9BACI|nr:flagellar export chaperone FliS [Lederbergia wuyishanensis]MCJ8007589.1 flagellar export chaperone FliS [Lederbergia wuyishanensis]MDQ0344828.1 flagellar protein FliS [Lederbergia wuyishanensis]
MDFLTKELIYQKTPQQLTAFLYEVCIDHLKEAIECIETKNYPEANTKLQKVNDILERLGVGLNYEAGIIADQLDTLYNYMANQVIMGNLKKDIPILQEVLSIVEQLASAWNEAMNTENTDGQRELFRKTSAYEKNVMVAKRD